MEQFIGSTQVVSLLSTEVKLERPHRDCGGPLSCQMALVGRKEGRVMRRWPHRGSTASLCIQSVQHTYSHNSLGLHARVQVANAFKCCLKRKKKIEKHGSTKISHFKDEQTEDYRPIDHQTNVCYIV